MKRMKKFLALIWEDIGPQPEMILPVFFCSIVISAIVMTPITGLAYFLAWIMDRETMDGAFEASVAIHTLVLLIILGISYFRSKWMESNKNNY